jgi:ABC-type polysaccharide transport system permease subunit
MKFIGLRNFENLLTLDDIFLQSIVNTIHYLLLSVALQIPMAYFLAVVLTQGRRFDKAFRNIIFVPVTLSGTAVRVDVFTSYTIRRGPSQQRHPLVRGASYTHGWLRTRTPRWPACASPSRGSSWAITW